MRASPRPFMRLNLLLVISALTCAPFITGPAAAAGEFEGTIHMDTKSSDGDVQMIYFVKPKIMRIEMRSGQGSAITIQDFESKKLYTLIPQMKQYAVTPLADDEGSGLNETPPVKTGKMEKILGYKCELYKMKSTEGKMEMWVTKEIPSVKVLSHNLDGNILTPLKTVTYDKSGKEVARQEVTKIEEKKLSSALFKPPASYKQFEMSMPDFTGYQ
ncbi:MAG: DUF4412 domain-containing protein [Nitrospinota bacterium]